jgi:hypothetical protein
MSEFVTRAYNSFIIEPTTNRIIKKSSSSKLLDEIKYLTNFPKLCGNNSALFPIVIDAWQDHDQVGNYNLMMELYAYPNLGQILINEPFNEELWQKIIKRLHIILDSFSIYTKQPKDKLCIKYLTSMYIDKTEKEYINLTTKFDYFRELSKEDNLYINGKECLNFKTLWLVLKHYIIKNLCQPKPFSIIHGDMCLSNILCGRNGNDLVLKFIDPRGSFGKQWIYGDSLYDIAKLLHSFEGCYEYIIYDKYRLAAGDDTKSKYFSMGIIDAEDNCDILTKLFTSMFGETTILHARLIEGLIFIGMCARHYENELHQKLMYLTGISILNDVYKEVIQK